MKNKWIGGLFVIAAASVLAACAAHAPVSPAASPVAAAGAAAPSTALASDQDKIPAGYRRVVKNGVEYLCSKEGMTGSRTATFEQCLTKEQLAARRDGDQDFLRRQQNRVGDQVSTTQGSTGGVMSH
jgi:hypothetical protein